MKDESQFLSRTHTCGELRGSHEGTDAILTGWVQSRRDLGGAIFIDLRDRFGVTQVVFREDLDSELLERAAKLRPEFCVGLEGTVKSRGDNVNPRMPTGEIEVHAADLCIFSRAETPPFEIEDGIDTREELRLRHRYLDLRRPEMQNNFMLRAQICAAMRSHLDSQGFLEMETPFMIRNTPGGARNFLVASRESRGSFYALAESPQLYKQLFMVSGFDRYYQIVRCFRDEDLRGDRQLEFSQVDIEMSFADEEDIYYLVEGLMKHVMARALDVQFASPFQRLTYDEALEVYGTDKPDLRFDLPLTDITDLCRSCGFKIFEKVVDSGGIVKVLRVPDRAADFSRKDLDGLSELVKPVGAKGVAWVKLGEGRTWKGTVAKAMSPESRRLVNSRTGAAMGDLLLFAADRPLVANNAASTLRLHMADRFGLIEDDAWSPVWITDFPLLEVAEETGDWVACHHPFTSPNPEDMDLLETDRKGEVRARAYDLVLNGVEVAGGSIRIHQADLQQRMFTALGIGEQEAAEKLGFLLEAFRYGPPPHGGVAFGLDRLVMLLCGAGSLREVIAFPKTTSGTCPLTGAPSPVEESQLKELGIKVAE